MNKSKSNKFKVIKKNLKQNNDYKEYKKLFKNKQTKFLCTKISIIFESSISEQDLTIFETTLLKTPTQDNFVFSINELSKYFGENFVDLKWDSFGVYLWYTFQTSLFYNKKRKIPCEYTLENFIILNNIKRKNFSQWLESFYDLKNINFNQYVIKVLKDFS